jgi:hypothetical protein
MLMYAAAGSEAAAVMSMTLMANAFARLGEFENAEGEEVFRQLASVLAAVDPLHVSPLQAYLYVSIRQHTSAYTPLHT